MNKLKIFQKEYRTKQDAVEAALNVFGKKWKNVVEIYYEPNVYFIRRLSVLNTSSERTTSIQKQDKISNSQVKRIPQKDYKLPHVLEFKLCNTAGKAEWICEDIEGIRLVLIHIGLFKWRVEITVRHGSTHKRKSTDLRSPDDCIRYIYRLVNVPYFLGFTNDRYLSLFDMTGKVPEAILEKILPNAGEYKEEEHSIESNQCPWSKGESCEHNPISDWCGFCENYAYNNRWDD